MKWIAATAALLLAAAAHAQALQPSRVVERNSIISAAEPALRIDLPASAAYVGAERWVLYGVADCEVHVFVEADADKQVRRLYWIQFEGYLPERPELRYNHTDPDKASIAGLSFFVRARNGPTAGTPRAGSDSEKVQAILLRAGYRLPAEVMNVRLVHLLDDQRRRELMLIYAEDLAPTGLSATALAANGAQDAQWRAVSQALVERAVTSFSIVR